jgi:hypothetical protein
MIRGLEASRSWSGMLFMVGARVGEELGSDLALQTIRDLTDPGPWAMRAHIGTGVADGAVHPRALDVVMPIVHGDPRRFVGEARFDSYFDACAWATVIRGGANIEEVEVVRFADLPSPLQFAG